MIDMERQEALDAAHGDYLDAFENMMAYQYAHNINGRTIEETQELARLTSICESAKYRWEIAKYNRYKVTV